MDKLLAGVAALVLAIAGIAFFAFLLALPFMLAWNYVVPDVFHLPELTWMQAWALEFVGATLFKSSK